MSDREQILPEHNKEIRDTLETLLETKPASAALIITIDVEGYMNYASWGVDEEHAKLLLEEATAALVKNPEDTPPKYLN
jgi:hypothetical protein